MIAVIERSVRGVRIRDRVLLAADFDDVSHAQFSASTGFSLPIHFDITVLNHQFDLPTTLGQATQFQEVIESQGVWNGN